MARKRNVDLARTLGARARELRVGAGLTQEALADRVGIQPTALSRFENGGVGLSLTTMQDLADALCVPLASFFASPRESISDEEASLLADWRLLPVDYRVTLRRMIQWARNDVVHTQARRPGPEA